MFLLCIKQNNCVFLTDPDYVKFVEHLNDETPVSVQPPDVMLEEIETREKEMQGEVITEVKVCFI